MENSILKNHYNVILDNKLYSSKSFLLYNAKKYKNQEYFGKIHIKDNVYIGQGTIIMPGVTIEENCIVGASSIVAKSVPKGSVVVGNPARFVSKIDDFIENISKYDNGLHGSTVQEKKEKSLLMKEDEFLKKPFLKVK